MTIGGLGLGSYEWVILFVGLLGVLVWELRSVRRSIRQAKADEAVPPVSRPE